MQVKDNMQDNYVSGQCVEENIVSYKKTQELSIRYLAERDLNAWLAKVNGFNALDYGSGLGFSVEYLLKQGFSVQAVDINSDMVAKGQNSYPNAQFSLIEPTSLPFASNYFDLVFSCFVLFELASLEQITQYLQNAKSVLKDDGYIIAIVASAEMYNPAYNSQLYMTDFPENYQRSSGSSVKMTYKEINLTFTDYFWIEKDYQQAFNNAGLKIIEMHYPLGKDDENYPWLDEKTKSPLLLILAQKS